MNLYKNSVLKIAKNWKFKAPQVRYDHSKLIEHSFEIPHETIIQRRLHCTSSHRGSSQRQLTEAHTCTCTSLMPWKTNVKHNNLPFSDRFLPLDLLFSFLVNFCCSEISRKFSEHRRYRFHAFGRVGDARVGLRGRFRRAVWWGTFRFQVRGAVVGGCCWSSEWFRNGLGMVAVDAEWMPSGCRVDAEWSPNGFQCISVQGKCTMSGAFWNCVCVWRS